MPIDDEAPTDDVEIDPPFIGWVNATTRGGFFIGLHLASMIEVAALGYRRQYVILCKSDTNEVVNIESVRFPMARASWGRLTRVGLWTASCGGVCLYEGVLRQPLRIDPGDTVMFLVGTLRFRPRQATVNIIERGEWMN